MFVATGHAKLPTRSPGTGGAGGGPAGLEARGADVAPAARPLDALEAPADELTRTRCRGAGARNGRARPRRRLDGGDRAVHADARRGGPTGTSVPTASARGWSPRPASRRTAESPPTTSTGATSTGRSATRCGSPTYGSSSSRPAHATRPGKPTPPRASPRAGTETGYRRRLEPGVVTVAIPFSWQWLRAARTGRPTQSGWPQFGHCSGYARPSTTAVPYSAFSGVQR